MRFLILDTDYPAFLSWLYSQHSGLERKSYAEQVHVRTESLFGQTDFCADNLRRLGHEAWDIDANNEFIQAAWAREHQLKEWRWEIRLRRGLVPWLSRGTNQRWLYTTLAAQIKHYKPDVLLNFAMHLSSSVLREVKPSVRLLIGSHASPLPEGRDFSVYDLVLSAVDNFVDYFRRQGLRSELLRFGFEPAVLERLGNPPRSIPISFVGNLFGSHASRLRWLEHVCQQVPVQVWMPSADGLPGGSPVIRCRRGAAWGVEMYEVLHKSLLTLNHHIDVAESYAGNLRLFEATGVGALLITDWKKNLHEMFEPGKEVVAYRTSEECVEMIQYYLDHEHERQTIANAGQKRTLRDHTYHQRMQELVHLVTRDL